MFDRLFRNRRKQDALESEIVELQKALITIFTEAWRDECQSIGAPAGVSAKALASMMEAFSAAAFRVMFERFSITKHAPPRTLWLIVFTSVLEAKTHPTVTVDAAIEILRSRYARKGLNDAAPAPRGPARCLEATGRVPTVPLPILSELFSWGWIEKAKMPSSEGHWDGAIQKRVLCFPRGT
jgi:hypothetical protein